MSLMYEMKTRHYTMHSKIFDFEDPVNSIFLIKSGSVELQNKQNVKRISNQLPVISPKMKIH